MRLRRSAVCEDNSTAVVGGGCRRYLYNVFETRKFLFRLVSIIIHNCLFSLAYNLCSRQYTV